MNTCPNCGAVLGDARENCAGCGAQRHTFVPYAVSPASAVTIKPYTRLWAWFSNNPWPSCFICFALFWVVLLTWPHPKNFPAPVSLLLALDALSLAGSAALFKGLSDTYKQSKITAYLAGFFAACFFMPMVLCAAAFTCIRLMN